MLDRGPDSVPLPSRRPSSLQASAWAPRTRNERPAAVSSLAAAGRRASWDGGADLDRAQRVALLEEVQRLRRRASQQDEALTRLGEVLGALRSACKAFRAENRELRLALQKARPSTADPTDGDFSR